MGSVTKKDLEELTKNLISAIKSESSSTERRLTNKLSKLVKSQFGFYSETLSDKVEYQLEEAVKTLRNENLNFKDEIISEIVDLRQELTINSSHKPILVDHEARITKVEKTLFSN